MRRIISYFVYRTERVYLARYFCIKANDVRRNVASQHFVN